MAGKITEMTAATSLALTDKIEVATDPGGTPATKSATLTVLKTALSVPAAPYTQGARVYNSGALTTSTGNFLVLTFDTESYDTDGIHSVSTNTGRLTCQTAGKYLITGCAYWSDGGTQTGTRWLQIFLNNTTIIGAVLTAGYAYLIQNVLTVYDLAQGDYVELRAKQDAGGNRSIGNDGVFTPAFCMQRIG